MNPVYIQIRSHPPQDPTCESRMVLPDGSLDEIEVKIGNTKSICDCGPDVISVSCCPDPLPQTLYWNELNDSRQHLIYETWGFNDPPLRNIPLIWDENYGFAGGWWWGGTHRVGGGYPNIPCGWNFANEDVRYFEVGVQCNYNNNGGWRVTATAWRDDTKAELCGVPAVDQRNAGDGVNICSTPIIALLSFLANGGPSLTVELTISATQI